MKSLLRLFLFFFLTFGLYSTTFATVPRDGLVGEYLFEGNANDTSGNGNDGIISNVSFTGGISEQSALFGGITNPGYIQILDSQSLRFGQTFALSFRTKVKNYQTENPSGDDTSIVFSKKGDFDIRVAGDTTSFHSVITAILDNIEFYGTPNWYRFLLVGQERKDDTDVKKWNNFVYTVANGVATIYINGQKMATGSVRSALNFGTEEGKDFYIGKYTSRYRDTFLPLDGQVDNVRIYNRALSDTEIQELYNEPSTPPTVQLPAPTDLHQGFQSPGLAQEDIATGSKVGYYQMGSGIIFQENLDNPTGLNLRMHVEVYANGDMLGNPSYERFSDYTTTTGEIHTTISDLPAGDYHWRVRNENNQGNTSDWVEFGGNASDETDFSTFDGFEPYPYGYSFVNGSPDFSLLTGDLTGTGVMREKIPGNKWEIMDSVFPLSSFTGGETAYFDTFETLGLTKPKPSAFAGGDCFGLSLSALTQFLYPNLIKEHFPTFSNHIGTGYIWNSVKEETSTDENGLTTWHGLDDNIKTILSYQLYQVEANYAKKEKESENNSTPVDILNEIKDHPEKKYLLGFSGKANCLFGLLFCQESPAHMVVPYKVEGNKIYIWDSNYSYPFIKDKAGENVLAYSRYIEINTSNNTYTAPGYSWDKFEKISAVPMDEVYTNTTSPIGFNGNDSLYTLDGTSDLLLVDSEGRKTGYKDGETYEEIPGSYIFTTSATSSGTDDNTWKQIYVPQKISDIKIEVNGKSQENYNLMIAGGDYYTKISGIETNSGQIDTFTSTKNILTVDFDNNKTGTYSLLTDNFHNGGTGTVYVGDVNTITEPQQYTVDWNKVVSSQSGAINYQVDTNNDGVFNGTGDTTTNLPPVFQDTIPPTTQIAFSGTHIQNSTGSYVETVTISLSAIDNTGGIGVEKTLYALDDNDWQTYTGSITVTEEGDHTLQYYSVDTFGNTELTQTNTFTIVNTGTLKINVDSLGGDNTFSFTGDVDNFSITTTNESGSKIISSLPTGKYSFSKILPTGWALENNECANVEIQAGETTTCTVTYAKQGKIIIKKVTTSATTQTFPFVATYDANGFTLTAEGQNESELLDPNTYSVTEDLPDGWTMSGASCSDGSDPSEIILNPAETVTCTFTNTKKVDKKNGIISGTTFEDKNGNRIQDSGEKGLAGQVIYVDTNNDGKLNREERFTVTNKKGEYKLKHLAGGTYTVRERLRKDWMLTNPATGLYTVNLAIGQTVTDKNFGNFRTGKIEGIVFEDKNGNGRMNNRELPLKNWMITLTMPNGTQKTDITNGGGHYSFDNLGAGTYTVNEVLQTGWKQTTALSSIILTSGKVVDDEDIGNVKTKGKK